MMWLRCQLLEKGKEGSQSAGAKGVASLRSPTTRCERRRITEEPDLQERKASCHGGDGNAVILGSTRHEST